MSRELDAEVQRVLFGKLKTKFAPCTPEEHQSNYGPCDVLMDDGSCYFCAGNPEPLPAYSTDIAAAWMVVERMSEKDWVFDLVYYPQTNGTIRACAEFWFAKDYARSYEVLDTSLPLAICKAAIEAMKGEH